MQARWLLLSALLLATPALAAEAYVPFVAPEPPDAGAASVRSTTVSFDVQNLGSVPRRCAVRFVAAGEDGTAAGTELLDTPIQNARDFQRTCCQDASGLLVVSGAPQIAVDVSLTETYAQPAPNSLSPRLPVLTAADALPAGSQATLPVLHGDGAGIDVTSFGILNLGRQPAHCSVTNFPPYVQQMFNSPVVVPPLSVAAYPDVFGRPTLGAFAQPKVTCDQPFYPFALVYRGLPGNALSFSLPWVDFLRPLVHLR